MYHYSSDGELCWAYVGSSTNTCPNPPAGATGYNYDPAGNITSVTENGSTTTLAYNAADILCWAYAGTSSNGCGSPPGGATTYTYDGDGNITGASNGLAIAYNALNQATSITPPGGSALPLSYIGPGQNQLSQAGQDTLISTLLGVSSKTDGNKNTTFYVRDNAGRLVYEQVPAGTKYWYLADAKGSVVGLVKPDGTLAGGTTYTYDPYGNLTQGQTAVDNPWLFQGQYSLFEDQGNSFGLYHMGARFYEPGIERWTQQDPAVSGRSPLDQNPYVFAADNPIDNIDPTGLQASSASLCLWICISFATGQTGNQWSFSGGLGVGSPGISFGYNPFGTAASSGFSSEWECGVGNTIWGASSEGSLSAGVAVPSAETPECSATTYWTTNFTGP